LGIGILSVAVLALFAPASWAQVDPVTVEVQVSGTARPGATLSAAALVTINDGSTFESIAWTQTFGAPASIGSPSASPTDVTLATETAYKEQLIHVLSEPPIGADQLPPNVPVPEGEFVGGLQDRFQVVPANPFALEEAELVTLEAEVTTSSGVYKGEAEVLTEIPWKVKSETRNVAIGIPVLLMGKEQASYDWALKRPWDSTATLMDATSQYPEFTPDVRGEYVVTVTDMATDPDNPMTVRLDIYAGTWVGVVTGQDENGRPVAQNCTPCHREAGRAPDVFTPWAQTGHAEIFTDNLNTSTHYGEGCFACHTVGYDLDVFNYGVDDFGNYQGFLDAGIINVPSPDNWTTVLADFPKVAKLANIQCENCHGPQSSLAHNQKYPQPAVTGLRPRADISSNTCAVCHGEPLRHARFQQWQLSKHANYELAIDEGESGNCSRCHTGNGFLTWVPILLGEVAGDPVANLPASSITWTEDTVHPQTCVVCHDPHMIGTTTGNNTNATVRVSDETPVLVAGFKAPADLGAVGARSVGRGAMCMTCHNTRRGLRNDNVPFDDPTRAPHGGVQADLLMGQNAYLVDLGDIVPGEDWPEGLPSPGHSNQGNLAAQEARRLPDTCATCHMVKTPPPDLLAYNQGGTNHTFFASTEICVQCHPTLPGEDPIVDLVQEEVGDKLIELEGLIEAAILQVITEQVAAGNSIDLNGTTIDATNVANIAEIAFEESRGRQAITVTFTDGRHNRRASRAEFCGRGRQLGSCPGPAV